MRELRSSLAPVTIVSERHCRRTLSGLRSSEFSDAYAALRNGSQVQELNLVLRHPEATLCDLSNLEPPFSLRSCATIEWAYGEVGRALGSSILPSAMRVISGDDLRPEICVSGPSRADLVSWKAQFLDSVFGELKPEPELDAFKARGLQRTVPLHAASHTAQQFIREFSHFYSAFIHPAYWAEHPCLNLRRLYPAHQVWNDIAALEGNKLFVLSSGLSVGVSYLAATGDGSIYFTEHHRQNDPSQLTRVAQFSGIHPKPRAGDRWVVIDKAYSGGTIDAAADLLYATLGRQTEITKVALFPKSLAAVRRADYVVYAGRLMRVSEVVDSLTPLDWHLQLLRAAA